MARKKSAASFRHGKLIRVSEEDIRAYAKSRAAKTDAERVRRMQDEDIDYSEIPRFSDKELAQFRPVKKQVTTRIDADLVAWLKSKGGHYQTHLNAELRKAMQAETGARRNARRRGGALGTLH